MARDKWLHVAAGVIAFVFGWMVFGPAAGAAAAIFAGVGRELWQLWTGRGTVDPWDAVATAAPGVVLWLALGAVGPNWGVGGPEFSQVQHPAELIARVV